MGHSMAGRARTAERAASMELSAQALALGTEHKCGVTDTLDFC